MTALHQTLSLVMEYNIPELQQMMEFLTFGVTLFSQYFCVVNTTLESLNPSNVVFHT